MLKNPAVRLWPQKVKSLLGTSPPSSQGKSGLGRRWHLRPYDKASLGNVVIIPALLTVSTAAGAVSVYLIELGSLVSLMNKKKIKNLLFYFSEIFCNYLTLFILDIRQLLFNLFGFKVSSLLAIPRGDVPCH